MKGDVLILDEPTSGLDPRGRASLVGRLRELNRAGMTMIMVSHSMEDMAQLVNRIVVLSEGAVAMDGSKRDVFSRLEDLSSLSLDVPRVTHVMLAMRRAGLSVPLDVLTVDEGIDALAQLLRGKDSASQ